MPFNLKYTSTDPAVLDFCESIWDGLTIDKTKKVHLKKECLTNAIINLKLSWTNSKYVRYSRRKNYYGDLPRRYKKDFFTYDNMVSIMDGLESQGLVISKKGFINLNDQSKLQTAVRPVNDLSKIKSHMIQDTEPPELIVLKDRTTGAKINYNDTDETRAMRLEINQYNMLRQDTKISLSVSDRSILNLHSEYFNQTASQEITESTNEIVLRSPFVYRVFNTNFSNGGRYYSGVESNAPKEVRSKFLINGNPTVEKDYGCLHIGMLYNLEGKKLHGDAYQKVSNDDPGLRSLFKLIGLVSINSKNLKTCLQALRNEIRDSNLSQYFESLNNKNLLHYYDQWVKAHPAISKYLNSDIGIKLQFRDSKLAEQIIRHFTLKDVPVLVVHDSFIVEKKYGTELEDVMMKVYKEEFKFKPVVN